MYPLRVWSLDISDAPTLLLKRGNFHPAPPRPNHNPHHHHISNNATHPNFHIYTKSKAERTLFTTKLPSAVETDDEEEEEEINYAIFETASMTLKARI